MKNNCILCNKETSEEIDKKGRIYHFCDYCGFISLDSFFYLSFQDQKERYSLHNNNLENKGYVSWLEAFTEKAVVPWIDKGGKILDYGSGPNPVLQKLLISRGYKADYYDKFFHDYPCTGLYDAVTSTEVIEHVEDPSAFLQIIINRLKPGGILAVKTSFVTGSRDQFLSWWYKEDTTHISFFSYKTFLFLSELLKLEILYTDKSSIIVLNC